MSDDRPPKKPINPYAAPSSDIQRSTDTSGSQLASRFKRLVARFIDETVIIVLPVFIVSLFNDSMIDFFTGPFSVEFVPEVTGNESVSTSWLDIFVTIFGEGFTSWWFFLLEIATFVLLNTHLLATRGQTLGKAALGIQIVGYQSNNIPPLTYTLVIREGGMTCLGLFGYLGAVVATVELLFIFGNNRRCLHDYWSSTKVVNVRR